jgi:hypothetical protein
VGLQSHRVCGSLQRIDLLTRVLQSDLGVLGILVRASLDLGSAIYPSCHKLLVLVQLYQVLSFLLALAR